MHGGAWIDTLCARPSRSNVHQTKRGADNAGDPS
jgi:hypothetical protein